MKRLATYDQDTINTHLGCVAKVRTIHEWNGYVHIPTLQHIELSCPEEDKVVEASGRFLALE